MSRVRVPPITPPTPMSKTFFTADTHLQHEGILEMAGRLFRNIDEHDECVIKTFNLHVKANDRLIIAGDVAWRTVDTFLSRLICKNVHLIVGNHDKASFGKHFKSVADVGEFKIKDHKVFVSHYPHAYWPASHYGSIHLYGHVHADREETLDAAFPGRRSMDCGLDNAYRLLGERRPFSEDEILSLMLARPGHDDVAFYKALQDARPKYRGAYIGTPGATRHELCGIVPPYPGYKACAWEKGHEGPCGHDLDHVCGLTGYNGMKDPQCPGCAEFERLSSQSAPAGEVGETPREVAERLTQFFHDNGNFRK